MPPFLGFVLVTHSQPEQTAFLCWKLSSMFGNPPIAIHHDFSKCELDVASLPPQTLIVKDWRRTAWGTFSLVEAYLSALRLLHTRVAPEWTVSLSGADYPIKSAEYIVDDLRMSTADAFLDFREVRDISGSTDTVLPDTSHYDQPKWLRAAWGRYLGFSVVHYHLRKLFGRADQPIYLGNALTTWLLTPFSGTYRAYAGDTWHTANQRATAVMLLEDAVSCRLKQYYRNRIVPDESYYQTLLLNRPELFVDKDNRRFSIWGDAPHPKLLDFSDIPAMLASKAHFARKFPFDLALYRAVDAGVDACRTVQNQSTPV